MRGKRSGATPRTRFVGITPAGAGKTLLQGLPTVRHRDHPRRCGENHQPRAETPCEGGSPPQVRGKLACFEILLHCNGITPAGAGKTTDRRLGRVCAQDHPRRCGENSFEGASLQSASGSPPQVRGKPHRPKERGGTPGITPAGAGKTFCRNAQHRHRKDHPRRCGENLPLIAANGTTLGSPPQVRGKPFVFFAEGLEFRITPAGAGKTYRQ